MSFFLVSEIQNTRLSLFFMLMMLCLVLSWTTNINVVFNFATNMDFVQWNGTETTFAQNGQNSQNSQNIRTIVWDWIRGWGGGDEFISLNNVVITSYVNFFPSCFLLFGGIIAIECPDLIGTSDERFRMKILCGVNVLTKQNKGQG